MNETSPIRLLCDCGRVWSAPKNADQKTALGTAVQVGWRQINPEGDWQCPQCNMKTARPR